MTRRKLVAGNWKMNGVGSDLDEIARIAAGAREHRGTEVALCLPASLIERAARRAAGFQVGGQDVHREPSGAHTGDISAAMLVDAGARLVIVGHSERREAHGETDQAVSAKAEAALAAGLGVILCVGESLEVRDSGGAIDQVTGQLGRSLPTGAVDPAMLAIAYEPIWAIGTGRVPATADIGAMHGALRALLCARLGKAGEQIPLLYGGSVKPSNAAEIFGVPDVDGALVGGASLLARDFLPIVAAASLARAGGRSGPIESASASG